MLYFKSTSFFFPFVLRINSYCSVNIGFLKMLFFSCIDGIYGWQIILKRISQPFTYPIESLQPSTALFIYSPFFIIPLGISTDFEAVRVKSNPAWLVHRGHFHNTCCSSQISLLNWGAGGYQSCQLHAISSNLLLNCLQKLQYIHMWVSKQKHVSAEVHSVRVFFRLQHCNLHKAVLYKLFEYFFIFCLFVSLAFIKAL